MNCPFFKEQRVKFCSLSAYRKMILLDGADTAHEVCSGPSYPRCSLFRRSAAPASTSPVRSIVCPSLQESLIQYCTAAAFKKFIPASEPKLLRCGRPAFRYCDLYRATVSVDLITRDLDAASAVSVRPHLAYAANHMWMDQIGTRQCQIGIDAFLTGLVGTVDQLSFLTLAGLCRPAVVITVKGVNLHLTFPARIQITASNLYLRAVPARLAEDPYGAGWLFEGEPEDAGRLERTVFRGTEAASWIEEESRRLGKWRQERVKTRKGTSAALREQLTPEDYLSLFAEFFSIEEIDRR